MDEITTNINTIVTIIGIIVGLPAIYLFIKKIRGLRKRPEIYDWSGRIIKIKNKKKWLYIFIVSFPIFVTIVIIAVSYIYKRETKLNLNFITESLSSDSTNYWKLNFLISNVGNKEQIIVNNILIDKLAEGITVMPMIVDTTELFYDFSGTLKYQRNNIGYFSKNEAILQSIFGHNKRVILNFGESHPFSLRFKSKNIKVAFRLVVHYYNAANGKKNKIYSNKIYLAIAKRIAKAITIQEMIIGINNKDRWFAELCIESLGKLHIKKAVFPLIRLIKFKPINENDDYELQWPKCHAITALGNIGDKISIPTLIEVLQNPNQKQIYLPKLNFRVLSAEALLKIGAISSIPTLESVLKKTTDKFEIISIAKALAGLGVKSHIITIKNMIYDQTDWRIPGIVIKSLNSLIDNKIEKPEMPPYFHNRVEGEIISKWEKWITNNFNRFEWTPKISKYIIKSN